MGTEKQIYGVVPLGNITGAVAIDASKGSYFTGTLTGDATLTVSNVKPGHDISVQLSQDGVGGHAVTWVGVTNGTSPNGAASTTTTFFIQCSTQNMSACTIVGQAQGVGIPAGTFLKTTTLTVSGNFTTSANTTKIKIRGVGGGGAGGGCTSLGAAAAGAPGGGSGAYAEKTFSNLAPSSTFAFVCGAGGVGASGANGGAGGDSTFTVGATTVTAGGGKGGFVGTAATTLTVVQGDSNASVATNGDLNCAGSFSQPGFVLIVATPICIGGAGAASVLGGGAQAISVPGNGNAAGGFGGGGGGSCTGASAARTGGAGAPGCWIVDEYS